MKKCKSCLMLKNQTKEIAYMGHGMLKELT